MSMSEEKRIACEQIVASLKDLYAANRISTPQYYKGLVSVAYEYAVAEEMNECLSLLGLIPVDYVAYELGMELENDRFFTEVFFNLAKILEQSGVVALESEVAPNMSPAKA